ncbi:histidinol-phosphatase [Catenulispora sp. GP43]|uniref:inositol monophosphatase family protein n=1 Tax=Catenulispora sp. GP43 TaxID=3156263 RepID=UPI0035148C79
MTGRVGHPDDADLALLHRMADVADEIALRTPGPQVRAWRKADGSAVSEADIEVETALLAMLAAERPADSVLSEECGARQGTGGTGRRWIIDPIDGTSSFLAGGRDWGTHIALEDAAGLRTAVITRPTEGLRYWALRGAGAYLSSDADPEAPPRRLTMTAGPSLAQARVSGFVEPGSRAGQALADAATWVEEEVCAVGALLEGRLEALLDEGGQIWDQAPVALLVPEAGGVFRDAHGGMRPDLGWALACRGGLCEELWAVLKGDLP